MIKKYIIASRPWSFPVSIAPIVIGTCVAASSGFFNVWRFILTLIAGVCLHIVANYINTYGDFKSGVDTLECAFKSPELVRGELSEKVIHFLGLFFLIPPTIIGLYLTKSSGIWLLILGIIGVLGAFCYTGGPKPYKYEGLGSIFVFFLMGVFMVQGAYVVQTAHLSFKAFLASLPISFIISAILHGNDIRDISYDVKAGIRTLATFIGEKRSFHWMKALYFLANICLLFPVLSGSLSTWSLLPILLLPLTFKEVTNVELAGNGNREALLSLEGRAAGYFTMFSAVYCAGLIISLALH